MREENKMKEKSDIKTIEFEDAGTILRGRFFTPKGKKDYPLVILATGDGPSGSNGLTWRNLVPLLIEKGIGAFLFDFAGLGNSDGERRNLTLKMGMSNFICAIEEVRKHKEHNPTKLGIIAASFGGNVALLIAEKCQNIKAIGLKSPCCYLPEAFLCEYGEEQMRIWQELDYTEKVGFNYTAVEEALRLNTYVQAEKINIPIRVVHGNADSIVPVRQVRDLMRFLKKGELIEIDGADHWYSENDEWDRMAKYLVDFMEEQLVNE